MQARIPRWDMITKLERIYGVIGGSIRLEQKRRFTEFQNEKESKQRRKGWVR
ncbi:MAG: hypothetical protein ACI8V2_001954 [Candidatus Latescibacterota bacterium]|jgi:hypothetical protein